MQHELQNMPSSKVPVWFERKFEFTFPVEHYPNLCVRLRGTPARLEEMVRGISREVLVAKLGEKWSVQEHVGHLLDLEQLWAARVDDFLSDRKTLTVADLKPTIMRDNCQRFLLSSAQRDFSC